MERGRYIDAPRALKLKVAEELGMNEYSISRALNYQRDGEKSRKARELVLASGQAKLMSYLPECETIHDSEGYMRQIFGNGYLLVLEKATGKYEVYKEGSEVGSPLMSGVVESIADFMAIQQLVERIGL